MKISAWVSIALLQSLLLALPATAEMDARAVELAKKYPLVDTHIDVPYRIHNHWEDVTAATEEGEFDYPRAVAGGLNAIFMSIYVPSKEEQTNTSYKVANILIDQVEAMVYRAPDKFAIARTAADVQTQFAAGKISLALGMENASPIEGDLEKMRHFYARGVRYMTLTHALANHISDSSYDKVRLWQGLSPFGAKAVLEMNQLGIMVDISHVSDEAFAEVMDLSLAPVIASHSSARHFTPEFERNMSDEMITLMGQKDGVIMINFGSSFLTKAANEYSAAYKVAAEALSKRNGLKHGDAALEEFERAYRSKHPYPFATVATVADHIDHVVTLAGIDHVGLGSDYDGVGDSLPIGLKDVSQYPNLVAELLARDYSEKDIAKILGGNILRVWAAVERTARESRHAQ